MSLIVYFWGNGSFKAHPSGLNPHLPFPEYIDMEKISLHVKAIVPSGTLSSLL